jgi:ElaB/YqjD/DUF883 family membrane-anchored ribosome-binding protein
MVGGFGLQSLSAADGEKSVEQKKKEAVAQAKELRSHVEETIKAVRSNMKLTKEKAVKNCYNEKMLSMRNTQRSATKASEQLASCVTSDCIETKIGIIENAVQLVASLKTEADSCSGKEVQFGTADEKEQREIVEDPDQVGDEAMEGSGDPNDANQPTVGEMAENSDVLYDPLGDNDLFDSVTTDETPNPDDPTPPVSGN